MTIAVFGTRFDFNDVHDLREIGDKLPDLEFGDAYGTHPDDDLDEWQRASYKQSGWAVDPETVEPQLVSIVSQYQFEPHDYGSDIVAGLADAIERFQTDDDYPDFDVSGFIETSDTYHKFLGQTDFDGVEINPGEQEDPIKAGIRATSGNWGGQATKFTSAWFRELCSNGLIDIDASNEYRQTHHEAFDESLPYVSVRGVLDGLDDVEAKLEKAQETRFRNKEEAIGLLYDLGIPDFIDGGHGDVVLSYEDQVDDRHNPSAYELYQAATNLLSNRASDNLSQIELNRGFEAASQLIDDGSGDLPSTDAMAEDYLERRAYDLTDADDPEDIEQYDGELEDVQAALEERGITA